MKKSLVALSFAFAPHAVPAAIPSAPLGHAFPLKEESLGVMMIGQPPADKITISPISGEVVLGDRITSTSYKVISPKKVELSSGLLNNRIVFIFSMSCKDMIEGRGELNENYEASVEEITKMYEKPMLPYMTEFTSSDVLIRDKHSIDSPFYGARVIRAVAARIAEKQIETLTEAAAECERRFDKSQIGIKYMEP